MALLSSAGSIRGITEMFSRSKARGQYGRKEHVDGHKDLHVSVVPIV